MNAQGYMDDFDRFLRAGRIGSPAPELDIVLEQSHATPYSAEIRGAIHAVQARVQSLGWRMRGEMQWSALAVIAGRFSIPCPRRVGVVEFRCVGVPDDGQPEIVGWGFVEIAWPAGCMEIAPGERIACRHAQLIATIKAEWIESVDIVHADGSIHSIVLDGHRREFGIELPTDAVGQQQVELHWHACDGSHGLLRLDFEVTARPMSLELWHGRCGGLIYRTANADALELAVPGLEEVIALPPLGVLESSFILPVQASLRYRDEAGNWQSKPIVLDQAPRGWPALRGFRQA